MVFNSYTHNNINCVILNKNKLYRINVSLKCSYDINTNKYLCLFGVPESK